VIDRRLNIDVGHLVLVGGAYVLSTLADAANAALK